MILERFAYLADCVMGRLLFGGDSTCSTLPTADMGVAIGGVNSGTTDMDVDVYQGVTAIIHE